MPKLDDLSSNGQPPDPGASDGPEDHLVHRQARAAALSPADRESLRRVVGFLNSLAGPEILPESRRLIIKSGRRLVFLDTADIHWIEASGNYVKFHMGGESYVVRGGIGRITERLNQGYFARIHRSTVVNMTRIKELETCDGGEYVVVLKDGKKLSCSRGYCGRLQQMIKRGCAF